MQEGIALLIQQWQHQSWLEVVAVILALGYVWLAAKQNVWCWLCAFVSTGLYSWIFWEVSLPFQSFLNAYYLLMAVYGWYQWHIKASESGLEVSSWRAGRHIGVIGGLALASVGTAFFSQQLFISEQVYLDATVTVFSLFVTWMMANKILQNWLYWVVINSAAVYLYWQQGLLLTAVLFVAYVFFAVYGYYSWKKTLYNQEYELAEPESA